MAIEGAETTRVPAADANPAFLSERRGRDGGRARGRRVLRAAGGLLYGRAMLIVRDAQRAVLVRESFVALGVAQAERLFPEACRALGPEGVRDAARHALERALSYGLDRERDALRYLSVMLTLGRDFDRDPAHPWARQILGAAGDARGARLVDGARAVVAARAASRA